MPPKYTDCAAPGCGKSPRPLSRYCRLHYETLQRTRDLNGRVLTKGELRAHRTLAREFIARNAEHPSVATALALLSDLIQPKDTAGFLRREFERLRQGGADPTTMLASFIAMYSWAEWATNPLADRCFDLNVGRAVLASVPAVKRTSRNGKAYFVRVRGSHAEALGRHLRENLGVLGLMAARELKRDLEGPTAARRAIREGLETVPFNRTEEGSEETMMRDNDYRADRAHAALLQRREYLRRELARTRPGFDKDGREPHLIEGAERVRLEDELTYVSETLDMLAE